MVGTARNSDWHFPVLYNFAVFAVSAFLLLTPWLTFAHAVDLKSQVLGSLVHGIFKYFCLQGSAVFGKWGNIIAVNAHMSYALNVFDLSGMKCWCVGKWGKQPPPGLAHHFIGENPVS